MEEVFVGVFCARTRGTDDRVRIARSRVCALCVEANAGEDGVICCRECGSRAIPLTAGGEDSGPSVVVRGRINLSIKSG